MKTSSEYAVLATAKMRGTFSRTGSRSWYAEDLQRCLHPTLNSYSDAITYAERTGSQVFGVYCRHEREQQIRRKLGKGVVYTINGKTILSRSHESATEQPLNNDAFIPCVSEEAALALEAAVHIYFGKTKGAHKAVKARVEIADNRWCVPGINDEGQLGGTELFDFSDSWGDSISKFTLAVEFLTSKRNVNKTTFPARYYQGSDDQAADLIAHWLSMGGDMRDFFLLMKPRSGKNGTMLLGLARYIKVLIEGGIESRVVVDFISLWPSAFSGCIDDLRKYLFVPGINIEYVNTRNEYWQEKFDELNADPGVHCIIRFASMQSIDMRAADEYNNDEDREGDEETFEQSKVDFFLSRPALIGVIDESDHGMRTIRSTSALETFGYRKCLWMSGTDLYAIKHLVKHGNHYLYDLFQEIQDVLAGKIERRPLMRKYSIKAAELPFESMDPDDMDQQEVTRRITVLLKTNGIKVVKAKKSVKNSKTWSYNKVTDRFLNSNGDILAFQNIAEVERLWDMLWFDWEQAGAKSPESHRNVFLSMPSIFSCLALYNHIREGDIECKHEPLVANTFTDITNIERDVTDLISKYKKTVFITVGKMLRGAKAPWSAVVRLDERNDFKVGMQLELRAQNTDEEFFDVYDSNPFRASSMMYEMIRSRTNGKKITSEGRKLHSLIPYLRKGKFEVETVTWEDILSDYQAGSIREGYKRMGLLDDAGVQNAAFLLTGVTESEQSKKIERDSRAGKLGAQPAKDPNRKSVAKSEVDPLAELKKRALTIAAMLPELIILTEANKSEIDDLINFVPDDLFTDWLNHCGVKLTDVTIAKKRELVINLFSPEDINHQLAITCRKFKDTGIDSFDWSAFNREKEGDVSTPTTAVESLLTRLPEKFWKRGPYCIDPSCGTGEWVMFIANKLLEYGHDPAKYIYYADTSPINLRITSLRLGINNGFCYNKDDINRKGQNMNHNGIKKFDLYATNPPFQKADKSGRDDDNLWPSFLKLGHKLTNADGYMVLITPGSWASLGTNVVSPGSSIRKKNFDPKQVTLVDFTLGDHFDEGSTFTGYIIKNSKTDSNLTSELIFKDKVINGKFSDYPCFSLYYSNSEFIDIIKQFRSSNHYDMVREDPYHIPRGSMPKKIKEGEYSTVQTTSHPSRAYHTNAQDRLYTTHTNKFHTTWKAVFSYSGSWKVDVTNDCSLTDASMCVLTRTKDEAESVQSVLQSAPIKFLIDKVFRWGGYYNALFISWIPSLPMDKIYSDEDVYKLLFTKGQAELIQNILSEGLKIKEDKIAKKSAAKTSIKSSPKKAKKATVK